MKNIKVLRAIANKKRFEIACLLHQKGELKVGDINKKIGLSQSATSQHLTVLRNANVVKTRRESQMIIYSLDNSLAVKILELI